MGAKRARRQAARLSGPLLLKDSCVKPIKSEDARPTGQQKGTAVAQFGYAGEVLKIDLTQGSIVKLPTENYSDRFLGGRGIAAKLYWDMVPSQARALDAENCLIFATGPVTGFPRFASCRCQVCGKSPAMEPECFSYANVGGRWGIYLKYAGYDGLVIQGKSDKPVYIYINNDKVEVRDAAHLWGQTAFDTCDNLRTEPGKKVSVMAIGPAAENLISFATMLTEEGSSVSSGLGAVMGSKRLKAVVTAGDRHPAAADPEGLRRLADHVSKVIKIPSGNFPWVIPGLTTAKACYGCGIGCVRQTYKAEDGRYYKSHCQPQDAYRRPAEKYYGGWNEVVLYAERLFDGYGLETCVIQAMIEWLDSCHKEGILNDEQTGLPLARIGSAEFIEALTRIVTFREGFGDLLARGTLKAAEAVSSRARELALYPIFTRANEARDYDPRMFLHHALILATEPRRPISALHEAPHMLWGWLDWKNGKEGGCLTTDIFRQIAQIRWGSAAATDYTTYEGKALASKKIQDRTHAKESIILCDPQWPIMYTDAKEDCTGEPTLENQIVSAVTGRELDETGLNRIGERIFNLIRAIHLRHGWAGRKGDHLLDHLHEEPLENVYFDPECLVPDGNGNITSRKGAVVGRDEFEKMKSEYYELRGWDVASGRLTKAGLKGLELADIAEDLSKRGLLK
jgi:aldehyde:ferredoxin oxidoreductase